MLVLSVFCSGLFVVSVVVDAQEMQEKEEALIMEVEQASVMAAEDPVVDLQQMFSYTSDYQKETAAYEKSLLASYDWNREEGDIFKSGNLQLADRALRNIATGIMQMSSSYDLFVHAEDFEEKIADAPASYIGGYCQVVFDLYWIGACDSEELLAAFPQLEGYSLLEETGTFSADAEIHIMILSYMKNSFMKKKIAVSSCTEVNRWGIYIGTYVVENTKYYVFVDYIQGE